MENKEKYSKENLFKMNDWSGSSEEQLEGQTTLNDFKDGIEGEKEDAK